MKFTLHKESLGTTEPALKALRDEVFKRYDHKLAIAIAPANETDNKCLGYGIVIFDATMEEVIVIGDGFSSDGGGTGGAGHRAALAFLELAGLLHHFIPTLNPITFNEEMTLAEIPVDMMRDCTHIPIEEKPSMRIGYLYADTGFRLF